MCRCRRKPAVWTNVGVEPSIDRQIAPIRVVRSQQHRLVVVVRRVDGFRDFRMTTVRPDDQLCALGDGLTGFRASLDPHDAAIFEHDLIDGKRLTNLNAGFACRVDQQLVEHRPSSAVRDR